MARRQRAPAALSLVAWGSADVWFRVRSVWSVVVAHDGTVDRPISAILACTEPHSAKVSTIRSTPPQPHGGASRTLHITEELSIVSLVSVPLVAHEPKAQSQSRRTICCGS